MKIVYADDDQLSLSIVNRALQARGHTVLTIYTGDASGLQTKLVDSLQDKPAPHFVILDGHNLTLDEKGKPIVDIHPNLLMDWLRRNGLDEQTRFVLYSSDDSLLAQVRNDPTSGFWTAISKVGEAGGLGALLRLLEK
jgi:hypothetical protein